MGTPPVQSGFREQDRRGSWGDVRNAILLDDALDSQYFSTHDLDNLDGRYDAIGGMLSRMIDRADDFCKYSPGTDYRSITCKDDEFLFTDY